MKVTEPSVSGHRSRDRDVASTRSHPRASRWPLVLLGLGSVTIVAGSIATANWVESSFRAGAPELSQAARLRQNAMSSSGQASAMLAPPIEPQSYTHSNVDGGAGADGQAPATADQRELPPPNLSARPGPAPALARDTGLVFTAPQAAASDPTKASAVGSSPTGPGRSATDPARSAAVQTGSTASLGSAAGQALRDTGVSPAGMDAPDAREAPPAPTEPPVRAPDRARDTGLVFTSPEAAGKP